MGAAVKDASSTSSLACRSKGAPPAPDSPATEGGKREVLEYRFHPLGLLSLPFWPAIIALPLFLAYNDRYHTWIPEHLHGNVLPGWPAPLGLCLGLISVAIGQVVVVTYHILHINGCFGTPIPIQQEGVRPTVFLAALHNHLSQPEGFAIVGSWLISTWMFGVLPSAYYSFEGGIEWEKVAAALLLQDGLQAGMHYAEHKVSSRLYRLSHKPHHRFFNPVLFDAFDGSLLDTLLMILLPLTIVTQVVHCNVWTYMTIGSLYSGWLTLIHSEYVHPWDMAFRCIGFGTSADHHVHHRAVFFNYGHLFLYWDRIYGTYKSPADIRTFNKNV